MPETESKYPSDYSISSQPDDTQPSEEKVSDVESEKPPEQSEQNSKFEKSNETSSGMSTGVKVLIVFGVVIGGLVICGIVAFILSVTIVAVNPSKNFESARNTQRQADLTAILSAINQYTAESGEDIYELVDQTDFEGEIALCDEGMPANSITGIAKDMTVGGPNNDERTYINLDKVLVSDYLAELPEDPVNIEFIDGDGIYTGYGICVAFDGRVQIVAPNADSTSDLLENEYLYVY